MEALGSTSISQAPMGGGHAFRIPKTSVCRQYTIVRLPVSKFFLRLSREKSVKSMCYLKIYIKVYLIHKANHA